MAKQDRNIPLVDFGKYLEGEQEDKDKIAQEIFKACTQYGFVYISGCENLINSSSSMFDLAHKFFNQTEEEKKKVARGSQHDDVMGYVFVGGESLSNSDIDGQTTPSQKKTDLKETWSMYQDTSKFPNRFPDNIPGFEKKSYGIF
eukprot:TRINITY_DN20544_c0_g1_i1.p2 TRINITY_DN20544_c0_g1~~TRINITY_DN20544_c0_g1_i1.p2  ORF type:complete len:145 (-),score=49.44 TRINITY_DN20544_c0_g1_i1:646-1080(-)